MKSFCKHIAIIICIVITAMVIMDKIYTVAFNQGTPRNKVQYITQLQNTHIDYIFLGSSRVENHIDCAVVEKLTGKSCINLGLQGSKTNDSAAFLQMLQNNEVTYDKVLFQLDYAVNFDAYSPQFKSYITPYLNNETVSENIKEDLNQPWGYKIPYIRYAANDKLIGFREVLLQLTHKKPNVDLNNGYVLLTGNSVAVNGSLPQNIQKENDGVQLLQQLEPNHLIFYTSPYCNNVPNREAFMKELTSNYPQVFNYIGLFDNQKGKFSDCGHLNLNGSQLFTAQITQDILLNSH